MKKYILAILLIVLSILNSNAQSTIDYNKAFKGKWEGSIEGTTFRLLELNISTINCKLSGEGKVTGYSKVEGTNKTDFIGTVQLVDGYFDLYLKEVGNKTTNGIFFLHIFIQNLELPRNERKLLGDWTSNKTKKVKKVNLTLN